jgi:hypothetical protein
VLITALPTSNRRKRPVTRSLKINNEVLDRLPGSYLLGVPILVRHPLSDGCIVGISYICRIKYGHSERITRYSSIGRQPQLRKSSGRLAQKASRRLMGRSLSHRPAILSDGWQENQAGWMR